MQERNIKEWFSRLGSEKRYLPLPNFLLRRLLYSQYIHINIPCLSFPSSNSPKYCLRKFRIFRVENERYGISTIGYMCHVHLINPNPTVVELSKSDYCRAQRFDQHSRSWHRLAITYMNIFSHLRNSSWPSPSCDYQMNGKDICLGYTNLRGILDGKQTIRYESISDILISMFSGINKCSQGRNIFMIDFSLSQYQNFVISLICISAKFPAYTGLGSLSISTPSTNLWLHSTGGGASAPSYVKIPHPELPTSLGLPSSLTFGDSMTLDRTARPDPHAFTFRPPLVEGMRITEEKYAKEMDVLPSVHASELQKREADMAAVVDELRSELTFLLSKNPKCPAWYNYSAKATTHMCIAAPPLMLGIMCRYWFIGVVATQLPY